MIICTGTERGPSSHAATSMRDHLQQLCSAAVPTFCRPPGRARRHGGRRAARGAASVPEHGGEVAQLRGGGGRGLAGLNAVLGGLGAGGGQPLGPGGQWGTLGGQPGDRV